MNWRGMSCSLQVQRHRKMWKTQICVAGKDDGSGRTVRSRKSSLINDLQDAVQMQTGGISDKIERGKHTTRHSQIIPIAENTYIMDTPGFSSMDLPGFPKRICGHVIRSSCVLSLDADLSDAVTSESRIVALRLHLQKENIAGEV